MYMKSFAVHPSPPNEQNGEPNPQGAAQVVGNRYMHVYMYICIVSTYSSFRPFKLPTHLSPSLETGKQSYIRLYRKKMCVCVTFQAALQISITYLFGQSLGPFVEGVCAFAFWDSSPWRLKSLNRPFFSFSFSFPPLEEMGQLI